MQAKVNKRKGSWWYKPDPSIFITTDAVKLLYDEFPPFTNIPNQTVCITDMTEQRLMDYYGEMNKSVEE